MAFPVSPSNNDVWREGNRSFVYNSTLGVWDQVKEIDRSSVPTSSGDGLLITDQMVLIPGTAPDATEGAMYYNSVDNAVYIYNGTNWLPLSHRLLFTASASGGTKTTHGIYTVYTFLSGSTTWTPTTSGNVDILLVAGGGGAGGRFHSGGGGAGGVRQLSLHAVEAIAYTVVIGAGGAGGANANVNGSIGGISTMSGAGFTTLSAHGGGAGAGYQLVGGAGGSGGGGNGGEYTSDDAAGAGNQGGYSPVEGYAGASYPSSNEYHAGGGGGGAGAVGGNPSKIADGGDGIANYWRDGNESGTTPGIHLFGGGGVGSNGYNSTGQVGTPAATHGGGIMDTVGVANSGGGGGASVSTGGTGSAGGSGICVIRHLI